MDAVVRDTVQREKLIASGNSRVETKATRTGTLSRSAVAEKGGANFEELM